MSIESFETLTVILAERKELRKENEKLREVVVATKRLLDDLYPADIFAGVSGDEGPCRIVELRRLVDNVVGVVNDG